MQKKNIKIKVIIKKRTPQQVENSYVISKYFGFDHLNLPEVSQEHRDKSTQIRKEVKHHDDQNFIPLEELVSIIKTTKEEINPTPGKPLMLYHEGNLKGTHKKTSLKTGEKTVSLHIIGTPKSIAEAILIKTTLSILEEEGFTNLSLQINNIGGKEAMASFTREINAYYRKHMSKLNSKCRQLFKDGPHALISCKDEIDQELRDNAPSPLNYLTEANRTHFKEVIEYLESQNIPYAINKDLLGDPHYSSDTIFSVIDDKTGKILATGTRCNQLCKKIGYKKEIPASTVNIRLNKTTKVPGNRVPDSRKIKFFFIQLGFNAKLRSLHIIEDLRKAKIPVHQSLSRDKLSTQLESAQRLKVPYILMMGQQEAKEGTVVVRNTITNSQVSVPANKLVEHLKNLK